MKKFVLGLGLVVSMISTPLVALAGGAQDFTLHNVTGFSVEKVFIAQDGAEEWSSDVLGTGTLANDGSTTIHFTGFPDDACKFHLRIEDAAGTAWNLENVDLCATTNVAIAAAEGHLIFATN
ncbi:MAG: hypothetical protein H7338_11160 [Candidatus Sericytochromatia bacterium]|nr:hypothetical protein [Candidatus Sericytochromatia bacterium]